MKTVLASITLCALAACGGGGGDSQEYAAPYSAPCTSFRVDSSTGSRFVDGCGEREDRAHDAVAYFVATVAKPGSQEYRELVGSGLSLELRDGTDRMRFVAQSRNNGDLVIDRL